MPSVTINTLTDHLADLDNSIQAENTVDYIVIFGLNLSLS